MCLFVWVHQNYCLWPRRDSVTVALREPNTARTLRTWGTWVDVRGLAESEGLVLDRHKHLPTLSAVSVTVYWKTRALVETLNLKGTSGLLLGHNLLCYTSSVCLWVWSCWNDTVSLTTSLYFLSHVIFQSEVLPKLKQQVGSYTCKEKGIWVGIKISLCPLGDRRRASRVSVILFLKRRLACMKNKSKWLTSAVMMHKMKRWT